MAELTRAQLAALEVLVFDGGEVRGGHRRSQIEPVASVNTLAAHGLCSAGLARPVLRWGTYVSYFKATTEGRRVWAEANG